MFGERIMRTTRGVGEPPSCSKGGVPTPARSHARPPHWPVGRWQAPRAAGCPAALGFTNVSRRNAAAAHHVVATDRFRQRRQAPKPRPGTTRPHSSMLLGSGTAATVTVKVLVMSL